MRNMCTTILVSVIAACGSGSGKSVDANTADAFFSQCGEPGDQGDPDGVGKFCTAGSNCLATAPLCSVLGSKTTFFCTKLCTFGSADTCDADATCVCDGSNDQPPCACTPTKCLGSD
jgi:hypothetical protein